MLRRFLVALALVPVFTSATPSDVERPGKWAIVKAEPDPRPAPGEDYRVIQPVAPGHPAVPETAFAAAVNALLENQFERLQK